MSTIPRHLTVYKGKEEPRDKFDFLWLRYNDNNLPVLSFYDGENWVDLSGGGVSPEPVVTLEHPCYYSGLDNKLYVDEDVANVVQSMTHSNNSTVRNVPCDKKYFYIAIAAGNTLYRVITENNENITGDFTLDTSTFSLVIDGVSVLYKLYEFHLSSDIPLNAGINITIV